MTETTPPTDKDDWTARTDNPELVPYITCTEQFQSGFDLYILQLIKLRRLVVDIYNGKIYRPDKTGNLIEIPQYIMPDGYKVIRLPSGKKNYLITRVHRIIYLTAHADENIGFNICIHHVDGNKLNNSITNLRGLTHLQHSATHRIAHLRKATEAYDLLVGKDGLNANTLWNYINIIRVLINTFPPNSRARGRMMHIISSKTGCAKRTLFDIANMQSFKNVPYPDEDEQKSIREEFEYLIDLVKNPKKPEGKTPCTPHLPRKTSNQSSTKDC